jgi:(p)ppGpp synthase/HD superfamily hydrolase
MPGKPGIHHCIMNRYSYSPARMASMLSLGVENRESFFKRIRERWSEESAAFDLIAKAYDTAKDALRGIEREEGVRYFEHARGVALILLDDLNTEDPRAICLALLHDIIEENPFEWNLNRVAEEFDEHIVEGLRILTKPPGMHTLTSVGLAYHASFWYAPRMVAVVKLADR